MKERPHVKIKGIYLIGEPLGMGEEHLQDFYRTLEGVLKAGIRIFQLRIKREEVGDAQILSLARRVRQITWDHQCLFLLNDRPDLALLAEADGVHVGPSDLPVEEVRKLIGGRILGLSNHSWGEIVRNKDRDVDYFSIGPLYPTTSKKRPDPVVGLELLTKALPLLPDRPVVGIGGVFPHRVADVLLAGADCLGVISGIMGQPDPVAAAREYLQLYQRHARSGDRTTAISPGP